MGLDPPNHRSDRRVVGVEHGLAGRLVAEGEQHRDGLGCRRGVVVAPHGRLAVAASEWLAGFGVEPGHEGEERLVLHLAHEAKSLGRPAVPHAEGLAGVQVVAPECLDVVQAGVGAP